MHFHRLGHDGVSRWNHDPPPIWPRAPVVQHGDAPTAVAHEATDRSVQQVDTSVASHSLIGQSSVIVADDTVCVPCAPNVSGTSFWRKPAPIAVMLIAAPPLVALNWRSSVVADTTK